MGGRQTDGYTLNKAQSDHAVARLRELMRGPPKVTQQHLEKVSGGKLKQGYVSRLLGGKVRLTERTLGLLATALGTKPQALLPKSSPLANPGEQASGDGRSDPADILPPNVVDFIQRMEREKRYGGEVLQVMRNRFRWPELQYATESELVEFADRCAGFVERAKTWRAARGAGGGEHP